MCKQLSKIEIIRLAYYGKTMEPNRRKELEKQAKHQAEFCQTFSTARRVLILYSLSGKELSVGEIASAVGASLQNTSQHLRLMKERGVVSSHREGQTIYYRLTENELMKDCPLVWKAHQMEVMFEGRSTVT